MKRKAITQRMITAWVLKNPAASFNEMYLHFCPTAPDGIPQRTAERMKERYHKAQEQLVQEDVRRPVIGGVLDSPDKRRDKAKGRTFVFTSAQSNTLLHEGFYKSLIQFCAVKDAELHVSRFTYNKQSMGSNNSKVGTGKNSDNQGTWFDPRIEPYISDTALDITDGLVWCGELNILPTRVDPIAGFQNYTRMSSCIIPHAKMFMQSIPTVKEEAAKFIYTTGALTQRNYIQKAAGQKADFHHVFGALIVEVAEDGDWWVRQINASNDGSFYDLDMYVHPVTGITYGNRVQAVTHGDLHGNKLNKGIQHAVFKAKGVLDHLAPKEQFFHDTIDFQPRNHHNIKDPHFLHEMYCKGTDKVRDEFEKMADFLMTTAHRPWCKSFVVVSNHDQAINGWLRNPSALADPVNVKDWHYLNFKAAEARHNRFSFQPFSYWLKTIICERHTTKSRPEVLEEDSSYRILGEIEAAIHGHLGPNGARGAPRNIRSAGKVNSGHTHSAGIFEGVYTAGVYGNLNMGYNKGLSSWSHSLVVTYPNAKRTILTIKQGKAWR